MPLPDGAIRENRANARIGYPEEVDQFLLRI